MEKTILEVSDKEGLVKALGVEVNCKPIDIHIFVNGVDILEDAVLDTLKVSYTKKPI